MQKLTLHRYKFVTVSNLEFNIIQKSYLVHVFCNVRKLINKNNAMTLDFMFDLNYNAEIARI